MDSYKNFQPRDEEEGRWIEHYNRMSQYISEQIRGLSAEQRFPFLKAANPTDLSLMNLYLQALKKEDYETCRVAKALLEERGIKIPSEA